MRGQRSEFIKIEVEERKLLRDKAPELCMKKEGVGMGWG